MDTTPYSVRIVGRGEEMVYADGDGELHLERTHCNGHRLFCDNTSGAARPALAFAKRREVIVNLCDFFKTKESATIFVVDEADKDHGQLEALFAELVSVGHKVAVEYDSAQKRAGIMDEMYLGFLRAGKKLSIDGVDIPSVEGYWRWKKQQQSETPRGH
jgi:hypothetical protein